MARKSRKNLEAVPEVSYENTLYNTAAYIRLSVEDNKKRGDSLETQKSILQSYIAITPGLKLHDYYIDNGSTGTNFERPAFKRMLADAENGIINCIIVKDLSRFGRNALDTGYYIEKYLPSLKVRFIAVNDSFDTDNISPEDGIMLPLKNMINEAYSLDIGRKIKAQQLQSMKEGEYVGARPPYGYLKSVDNCHKLVVDKETAPVVRQIFQWAYEGMALNEINRRLNEAGILTPSHTKKASGLISHENLIGKNAWQTRTVGKILSSEVYTGDLVQGKTKTQCHKQVYAEESNWIRVENTHEAIISREMFEAVQEIRRQAAQEAVQKPKTPYTPNLFKGKIYCGHCGGSLHRQRCERKRSEDVYLFHCLSNGRVARGSCLPYSIPENELLTSLLIMIQKHADIVIGKAIRLKKSKPALEARHTAVKSQLAALRQALDRDRRMVKSLYEGLVSGIITSDEYRQMREDYETKIAAHVTQAQELECRQSELEAQAAQCLALSDLIEGIKGKEDITAAVIDRLIDRIRVFSDRHIEVDFSFESGFERVRETDRSLCELLSPPDRRMQA
nr:recombinase family protein [Sedimentibacter sp.]